MLGFSGTREWVYPQSIQGRFMTIRRWTFFGLHVLLFAAPWIMINGNPAFMIDLQARRFYHFGFIFTPSDTIILVLLLFFLASFWRRGFDRLSCSSRAIGCRASDVTRKDSPSTVRGGRR